MERIEDLSTEVASDDIKNGEEDEFGVVYSKDGKRLLWYAGDDENFTAYTVKDGTIEICDGAFAYYGSWDEVHERTDYDTDKLVHISIPDSVTTIGTNAFYNRSSLKLINIPFSVTTIGEYAFSGCSSLSQITIPNSVTTIGESAFSGCSSLSQITIPDSVTTIGKSAFWGCSSLSQIIIPDSVTTIGESVFWGCSHLQHISIPNTISVIDSRTFCNCTNLQHIIISNSITIIGENAFDGCEKLQQIILPNTIQTIGAMAFANCQQLQQVIIPNSVTTIGNGAFYNCKELNQIHISNNITTICDSFCEKCISLPQIIIPNSVTHIGDKAFLGCVSLQNIQIPNSVSTIGKYAFAYCSSLQQIVIPKTITTISEFTFFWCETLCNVILPSTITSIGNSAFCRCTSLAHINISDTVQIGDNVFDECFSLQSKMVNHKNIGKMKIAKISINNFRAFNHQIVEFEDFNCLIGKNDSGKSTLFAALKWFFTDNVELTKYDINANAGEKEVVSVDIAFSNADFSEELFDKDFINEKHEVYISKKLENPKSIDSDIVKPIPYYTMQTNCFTNRNKIFSDCSLEDLMEECIKLGIHKDFLSVKLSKIKSSENGSELRKLLVRHKYISLLRQDLYNYYISHNYEIKKGQKQFTEEKWFEFMYEWCYFCVPSFQLYTPLTPIKDYLNRIFNSHFTFGDKETQKIADEISLEVFGQKDDNKSMYFDYLECDFFPDPNRMSLITINNSESIPLKNRGDGFKQKIKNSIFKILAKQQYNNSPVVFAFEEPEVNLHPSAQIEMYKTIKGLSENSNYQVFMSTHSPYIVKELAKDNITPIIVRRDEDNNKSNIVNEGQERVLPYVSMNEINYIAFDLASEEFHQELYGQIEIDWFGESNGSKINQIVEKLQDYKCANRDKTFGKIVKTLIDKYNNANNSNIDLLANEFFSPDKGKEPSRCLCHCVRNSIDHPCEGNAKWKEYGLIDLSTKILLEIDNCFKDIKKTFFDTINHLTETELDDKFSNKLKYCIDVDGYNEQEHSSIYWLKYNYIDKKELFSKTYVEQKITTGKILKIKKEKDKHLLEIFNAVNLLNNYADKRPQNP